VPHGWWFQPRIARLQNQIGQPGYDLSKTTVNAWAEALGVQSDPASIADLLITLMPGMFKSIST